MNQQRKESSSIGPAMATSRQKTGGVEGGDAREHLTFYDQRRNLMINEIKKKTAGKRKNWAVTGAKDPEDP